MTQAGASIVAFTLEIPTTPLAITRQCSSGVFKLVLSRLSHVSTANVQPTTEFPCVELPRVNDALVLLNVGALNFFSIRSVCIYCTIENGKYNLPKGNSTDSAVDCSIGWINGKNDILYRVVDLL